MCMILKNKTLLTRMDYLDERAREDICGFALTTSFNRSIHVNWPMNDASHAKEKTN